MGRLKKWMLIATEKKPRRAPSRLNILQLRHERHSHQPHNILYPPNLQLVKHYQRRDKLQVCHPFQLLSSQSRSSQASLLKLTKVNNNNHSQVTLTTNSIDIPRQASRRHQLQRRKRMNRLVSRHHRHRRFNMMDIQTLHRPRVNPRVNPNHKHKLI